MCCVLKEKPDSCLRKRKKSFVRNALFQSTVFRIPLLCPNFSKLEASGKGYRAMKKAS